MLNARLICHPAGAVTASSGMRMGNSPVYVYCARQVLEVNIMRALSARTLSLMAHKLPRP